MQFHAHIGVYDEERTIGQDIMVNIELVAKEVDQKFAFFIEWFIEDQGY